jgi:uncharacterized protein (DUF983 family)
MSERAQATRRSVEDFGGEFLVVCPRCAARARVRDTGAGAARRIRATCGACGYARGWSGDASATMVAADAGRFGEGVVGMGAPVDWYFHLPLWLQAPCRGHVLWAYNERHLRFLRGYVAAGLRERTRDEAAGWANASLAPRLPAWMLDGAHRDEVMRAIDALLERAA